MFMNTMLLLKILSPCSREVGLLPTRVAERAGCAAAFLYPAPSRPVPQQSDLGGCNETSSMAVIKDYYALKENEICVSQGEVVQVLAVNQQNMCLVYQPASDHSPAAEGWVPGSILAPLTKATAAAENSDGSIK